MSKKINPFDQFKVEVKTAVIESMGGATIKYRELTIKESDDIRSSMITGYDVKTGNPNVDVTKALDSQYEKASLMLVEPKMSVEDLQGLGAGALDAINDNSKT